MSSEDVAADPGAPYRGTVMTRLKRVLLLVNPLSSRSEPYGFAELASGLFGEDAVRVHVMERLERASDVVRDFVDEGGADLVVVAGGDGTISGAASALSGSRVPIAAVPAGTANMLAEQLGIPEEPEEAMRLAAGTHAYRDVDAMELEGRLYFLNAGAGVSSRTVAHMSDGDKRRFGRMAYWWTGVTSGLWSPPVRFRVTIDGKERDFRGIEVSLINAGFREQPNLPGLPEVLPDDGVLDVMLVWTPTPAGYLQHLGDVVTQRRPVEPNVQWVTARKEVRIEAGEALPVQADGDIVTETPAVFRLLRGATRIVVPSAGRDEEATRE